MGPKQLKSLELPDFPTLPFNRWVLTGYFWTIMYGQILILDSVGQIEQYQALAKVITWVSVFYVTEPQIIWLIGTVAYAVSEYFGLGASKEWCYGDLADDTA